MTPNEYILLWGRQVEAILFKPFDMEGLMFSQLLKGALSCQDLKSSLGPSDKWLWMCVTLVRDLKRFPHFCEISNFSGTNIFSK